jgi:hypothetical protein
MLECARLECLPRAEKRELPCLKAEIDAALRIDLPALQGAACPSYLLVQVKELRFIADRTGPGQLAYALERVRLECGWLIQQEREERPE